MMEAYSTALLQQIGAYRTQTFRTDPALRIHSPEEAVEFVEDRGLILFWPMKNLVFPSLWAATVGDRPVPNNHDDPGHVTWSWKDEMLPRRRWYYGKLLRGKATFVSLDALPYVYALSPRYGDLDDYTEAYRAGTLSHEAHAIASILLQEGPQNSILLRKKAGLSSPSAKYSFHRALTTLQRGLWILPVRVAQAGTWNYAFEYELFDRWYPTILPKARIIPEEHARAVLLQLALTSLGCADDRSIQRLFGWSPAHIRAAFSRLEAEGTACPIGDVWAVEALTADLIPPENS
ncbi:MAG: winged helix DNA-binding domain-containing protein [Anaerolineales bacterium]|nr:winged helix DNA-binding domain-containing protein [Anaerolineales bacterium]